MFKPLARAATNALTVFVGLWGYAVTPDLEWLFAAIIVMGIINFGIGIHDERLLKASRQQANEDRQILRELQGYTRTLVSPLEIPAQLQDLSRLTNAQLKGLVEAASKRLRDFAAEVGEGVFDAQRTWWRVPNYDQLNEEEKNRLFRAYGDQQIAESNEKKLMFNRRCRPEALALWEELKRRLNIDDVGALDRPIAIEHGTLAGALPIEEAATALEKLARQLPDEG